MSYDKEIIIDTLIQVNEAIDMITDWSRDMTSADEYASSPEGMKTLAATCMLLEAIGEGIKKIDRRTEGLLLKSVCPYIPWKNIMGMRDHIAHGYFGIDADFVYGVVCDDLQPLSEAMDILIEHVKNTPD